MSGNEATMAIFIGVTVSFWGGYWWRMARHRLFPKIFPMDGPERVIDANRRARYNKHKAYKARQSAKNAHDGLVYWREKYLAAVASGDKE